MSRARVSVCPAKSVMLAREQLYDVMAAWEALSVMGLT